MTSITTRETAGGGANVKNAPLTNAEIDSNFISITTSKLEASNNLSDLTDTAAAKSNLNLASMGEQESNNVSITGGSISGITLTSSSIDFNGGTIDGATISNSTINNDISGTATNVSSALSAGDGLSGSNYDGSSAITFAVDGSVVRSTGDQTISGAVEVDSLGVNTTAPAANGDIRATGDIVSNFSSDIRNKENIENIANALNIVESIGGKTFDWSNEYINRKGGEDSYFLQKNDFGVIAQDVQEVFPLAVRERENGELAVDYVKLCSLAFAAIKELNEKVDSLITQQRNS